jgi:hypothetical protein
MPPNLSVATLRGLVIFYVILILPRLTPLGYIIKPPAEAITGRSELPFIFSHCRGRHIVLSRRSFLAKAEAPYVSHGIGSAKPGKRGDDE